MIFKVTYNNQAHLYSKKLSISSLFDYCSKVFKGLPRQFTFIYCSSNGQMTYVQTDADLIGLKYLCSAANDMIVRLKIMRTPRIEQFNIDEDIQTQNIVKQTLQELSQDVFVELVADQSNSESISQQLSKTYQNIASTIAQAEELVIQKQVNQYLFNLYQNQANQATQAAQKAQLFIPKTTKQKKSVRFSPQKPQIYRLEKTTDELVNQKLLTLIPKIVDKIYSQIQLKLNNKCKNCLKKQMKIQNFINEEINRKLSQISLDKRNLEKL